MIECIGCNPNGEYTPHEAHVECWQVGDEWVPCCSDRVLTWWATSGLQSEVERFQAGAPQCWIRPLQAGRAMVINGVPFDPRELHIILDGLNRIEAEELDHAEDLDPEYDGDTRDAYIAEANLANKVYKKFNEEVLAPWRRRQLASGTSDPALPLTAPSASE